MPGYGGILSGLVQGYGQTMQQREQREYQEKQKEKQAQREMIQAAVLSGQLTPDAQLKAWQELEASYSGGSGKKSQSGAGGMLSKIGMLLSGHAAGGGGQSQPSLPQVAPGASPPQQQAPPDAGQTAGQGAGQPSGASAPPPQQQTQGFTPLPQKQPTGQQSGLSPLPKSPLLTPEQKREQASADLRSRMAVEDEFAQKKEQRQEASATTAEERRLKYSEDLAKFNSNMSVEEFGKKVDQAEKVLGRPLNKEEREQAILTSLGVKQSMSIKFGPAVPGADIPEGTPDVYGQPVDRAKQYRQVIDGGKITGYQPVQASSSPVVIRPGADPFTGKPALLIFDKSTGKQIGKAADVPAGYEVKEGPDGNFVSIPKQFQKPTGGAGLTPPPTANGAPAQPTATPPAPRAGGMTPPPARPGATPPAAGGSSSVPKTAGGLSADALDLAAQKYLQTGQMTTLGYGKSAATQRAAILNRAAELERQRGGDSSDLPTQQAAFHASAMALGQLTKQEQSALAFEATTNRNLDIVLQNSAKVDRTGSPLANKYLLYLKGQVQGDADTTLLKNAVISAANEYAKVVSGSTGSAAATDSSRKEAEELLNASFSKGTTEKVIAQMKQEMENRRKGFASQKEELRKSMKGNPARPKPSKPGETITADKARSYLDMAGGNADEARKLAAQDGWTIK